jgi:hypothetical protein
MHSVHQEVTYPDFPLTVSPSYEIEHAHLPVDFVPVYLSFGTMRISNWGSSIPIGAIHLKALFFRDPEDSPAPPTLLYEWQLFPIPTPMLSVDQDPLPLTFALYCLPGASLHVVTLSNWDGSASTWNERNLAPLLQRVVTSDVPLTLNPLYVTFSCIAHGEPFVDCRLTFAMDVIGYVPTLP